MVHGIPFTVGNWPGLFVMLVPPALGAITGGATAPIPPPDEPATHTPSNFVCTVPDGHRLASAGAATANCPRTAATANTPTTTVCFRFAMPLPYGRADPARHQSSRMS